MQKDSSHHISAIQSLVLFFFMLGTMGLSHDLLLPDWRGQEGTTYQSWTFDDDSNPVTIINSYGQSTASVWVGTGGAGWLDSWVGFEDLQGFWNLGSDGKIELSIANEPSSESRLIYIQLYYIEYFGVSPTIEVEGAQPYEQENWQTVEVDVDQWGMDKLILAQSVYQISPASNQDDVSIQADPLYGSLIDQITVDTRSSPGICIVSLDDLIGLCEEWLQSGDNLKYDLDQSHQVDIDDFYILSKYWMAPCPW